MIEKMVLQYNVFVDQNGLLFLLYDLFSYFLMFLDVELDLDLLLRCRSGAEQVNVCKWEILTEVGVEVLDQQFGSGLTEAGRADPGHNLLHGGGHTEQGERQEQETRESGRAHGVIARTPQSDRPWIGVDVESPCAYHPQDERAGRAASPSPQTIGGDSVVAALCARHPQPKRTKAGRTTSAPHGRKPGPDSGLR